VLKVAEYYAKLLREDRLTDQDGVQDASQVAEQRVFVDVQIFRFGLVQLGRIQLRCNASLLQLCYDVKRVKGENSRFSVIVQTCCRS